MQSDFFKKAFSELAKEKNPPQVSPDTVSGLVTPR